MLVHLHKGKNGGADDSKERVQSMQSYGMEDWEDWKDYVAAEDCLMKHRTSDMYASKLKHLAQRQACACFKLQSKLLDNLVFPFW